MVSSFVGSVQSGDQSLPQSHFVLLQAFQVLLHFVAFRLVLQEIRLLKGVAVFHFADFILQSNQFQTSAVNIHDSNVGFDVVTEVKIFQFKKSLFSNRYIADTACTLLSLY